MLRSQILAYIVDAIAERRDAGAFPVDLVPDFPASALFGMTATTALDWLVFHPDKSLEHITGQIAALTSRAVRA